MASLDVEYDEAMGNPATRESLLSFARGENFFISTESALPWGMPADGDASRAVLGIVWAEALLRKAPVKDSSKLNNIPLISSCVEVDFIRGGLERLVDLGLLNADDGDDDAVHDYQSLDELQRAADKKVEGNREEARFQVDDTAWDDLEAVAAGDAWDWLEQVTLEQLTSAEGNLHVYSELSLALGPRALSATRNLTTSQFNVTAGTAAGGRLLHVLRSYFIDEAGGGAAVVPQFLAHKLDAFWIETRWPVPLDTQSSRQIDHAYDLMPRSKWQQANRAAWVQLVRPKSSEPQSCCTHSARLCMISVMTRQH